MLERQIFGEITFKIDGFDISLLAEKLRHVCKVIALYTRSGSLYLTTLGKYERKVKKLVEDDGCVYEEVSRKGIVFKLKKYAKRFGLPVGAIISAAAIFFLSNTVMKIDVKGTDDEKLAGDIKAVLREEGLKPGAYIPSLNFLELSDTLFDKFDSVGWASVGSSGSVVTVNINEARKKPDGESRRIPCNIVSDKDAVIVSANVKVGQLCALLGDAVFKGQLLVSGIIERGDGTVKYYHSYAEIIGRYEETADFRQDYHEEQSEDGDKIYRRSFCIFDAEIPLPGELLDTASEYSVKDSTVPVKLFGLKLPFSVKTYEYSEIIKREREYTYSEAVIKLYRKIRNYERSILSDKKIISRDIDELTDENGVSFRVNYVLEGEIGSSREIFIK